MRFLGVLVVLWLMAAPVLAQKACGPVVRILEGDYYLVQCNGAIPQVNDPVCLRRNGQDVARGQVMRTEGNLCSIRILSGEAQRMDTVYLTAPAADASKGPALPSFGTSRAAGGLNAGDAAGATAATSSSGNTGKSKRDSFFSGLGSGRVLNLNTGEMINEH